MIQSYWGESSILWLYNYHGLLQYTRLPDTSDLKRRDIAEMNHADSDTLGQNAISHPSEPTALNDSLKASPPGDKNALADPHDANVEDAHLPGSLPTLRQQNIAFSKVTDLPLPARIQRIWYISAYGHEMRPAPNPKVLEVLKSADAVIYSIGSLYTSIAPSLILQGVGAAISKADGPRFKILILNGSLDRETGGFSANDFLDAITRACMESQGYNIEPTVTINRDDWHKYVTHLIYLEGEGVPPTDKHLLGAYGVEAIRIYGRKDGIVRYDKNALVQALTSILGKREKGERSRRNSLYA